MYLCKNKKKMSKYSYEFLKENGLILFETIVGSQAYGTNIETSDIDKKFVYILPIDHILGFDYVEQIQITKDITGWEIKRFLELLGSNNPTVLELLNSPKDCILFKHPLFDLILEKSDSFITKGCKNSFSGYARQQIVKAKGLNKKQNWEKDKVVRKKILDFCYVIDGDKSVVWKEWNRGRYEEKFIGVVNVENGKDLYGLYYDIVARYIHSKNVNLATRKANKQILKEAGKPMGFGYKGLVKVGEDKKSDKVNLGISNQLRLSSIPKGENSFATISFNKDGYSQHCKDHKEYTEWLEKRNESRYVETKIHGQTIDSKNMMHCMRLIRMAKEIGSGKGIMVRRTDREYLLSIRRGEVDLKTLIETANKEINEMDSIFDNSDLPEKIEEGLVNELLITIRKKFYNIK